MIPNATIHFVNGRELCEGQYIAYIERIGWERGYAMGYEAGYKAREIEVGEPDATPKKGG